MRRFALAFLAVAGFATSFAYAAGAVNVKSLVLQPSDMPSGAKRVTFGSSKGAIKIPRSVHGQVAYSAWTFPSGGSKEAVGSAAGFVASSGDAHDVYLSLKRKFDRISQTFKPVSLPKYGNEQFAGSEATGGASLGLVFVRSGSRLWEVVVSGYPRFPKARMLGELKKYAGKEKSRAT
jgi:hypothetical protein